MQQAQQAAIATLIAPQGLLTPDQAADYLSISKSTLAVWRSTNRKRLAYVKVGGGVRYRKQDLDAFIASNLHNAEQA
jgi:excisionase family DNA binding protein